jgi:hypothetical protein
MKRTLLITILMICLVVSLAAINILYTESVAARTSQGPVCQFKDVKMCNQHGEGWCEIEGVTSCSHHCYNLIPDNCASNPCNVGGEEGCEMVFAGMNICKKRDKKCSEDDLIEATVNLCGTSVKAYVYWRTSRVAGLGRKLVGERYRYEDPDLIPSREFQSGLTLKEIKSCEVYECTNCDKSYCDCFNNPSDLTCKSEKAPKENDKDKKDYDCTKDGNVNPKYCEQCISETTPLCCLYAYAGKYSAECVANKDQDCLEVYGEAGSIASQSICDPSFDMSTL